MQTNFNREREFFLTSAKQSADNSNGLQDIIDQLKNELEEERNYSEKVWADEQVSLLCQKALYTHKYMNIAQENKIAHLDTRKAKDGHIVVSKEDQAKLFSRNG